ncbi:MAG: hypothetical protein GXO88_04280 [Chlorobi bacterium]|nr:hypothetical protein [Chlorobiota bacterium]
MDTEDKIIKKLLEKDLDIKAPANFTSSVMDAVLLAEKSQDPIIQTDTLIVMVSILISVISPVLVFYYFNISIFDSISHYFISNNPGHGILPNLLDGVNNQLLGIKALFVNSPLVLPLFLGLTALIIIDRIVAKSRRGLNLFISI